MVVDKKSEKRSRFYFYMSYTLIHVFLIQMLEITTS